VVDADRAAREEASLMARKRLPLGFIYARLDVDYFDHPTIEQVGLLAAVLNLHGILYARRHMTDGLLPGRAVQRWERDLVADVGLDDRDPAHFGAADRLVEAGLWSRSEDGFQVVGYAEYQDTRSEIEAAARGGRAAADARWKAAPMRDACVSHHQTETETETVPPDGGTPREPEEQVAGLRVTDRERTAARLLVERFNETFGTRFTAKAHQSRIVARLRSHPDCSLEEHYLMIDAASADRWWKGNPGPQVVWGNDSVFENLREKAGALDRSRRAQAAARLREEEARREREDVELVGPTPEALAALARLGVKRLDDHLEEGHHDREAA
jgi:hypothetical protein